MAAVVDVVDGGVRAHDGGPHRRRADVDDEDRAAGHAACSARRRAAADEADGGGEQGVGDDGDDAHVLVADDLEHGGDGLGDGEAGEGGDGAVGQRRVGGARPAT